MTDNPVLQAIKDIEEIHKKKAADYAAEGNPFSNFEEVAEQTGISTQNVIEVMIAIKNARIKNLGTKTDKPENEPLLDSYLDRAVYCIIAYAYLKNRSLPF